MAREHNGNPRSRSNKKLYRSAKARARRGASLLRIAGAGREERHPGMRLDRSCETHGIARGIRHGKIDFLGAVLGDAHSRMRWQRNIAETLTGTRPAAGGAQSIAAIIVRGGIMRLFLRQHGL